MLDAKEYRAHKRRREDYEMLSDNDEHEDTISSCVVVVTRQKNLILVVCGLLLVLLCVILSPSTSTLSLSSEGSDQPELLRRPTSSVSISIGGNDDHTLPTRFSLVHPDTGRYLNALGNPLYRRLRQQGLPHVISFHQHQQQKSLKDVFQETMLRRLRGPSYTKIMNDNNAWIPLEMPRIHFDRSYLSQHYESLIVSWTPGRRVQRKTTQDSWWSVLYSEFGTWYKANNDEYHGQLAILQPSDIMAIYCGILHTDEHTKAVVDPDRFFLRTHSMELVEAATLAQIRATHEKHCRDDLDGCWTDRRRGHKVQDHTWYIPSFPIIRHDVCTFHLLHHETLEPLAPSSTPLLIYGGGGEIDSPSSSSLDMAVDSPSDSSDDVLVGPPVASKTPTGIHISWTDDPSEMLVMFTTGVAGTPVARFGKGNHTSKANLNTKVEGTSTTYTAADMCQAPANITDELGKFVSPGQIHTIRLAKLEPFTRYTYQVGLASGQGIVWDQGLYSFTSAPLVGSEHYDPFSYIVYGDQGCPSDGWGQGGLWTAAMAAREAETAVAVHHFGDLSYAIGAAHIWDDWFHMIQVFAARIPLMVGVGNHEYDHTAGGRGGKDPSGVASDAGFHPEWGNFGTDSGGECGVPTSRRFTMPGNNSFLPPHTDYRHHHHHHSRKHYHDYSDSSAPSSNGVYWYSHDYANVHTIMLSSEHNLTEGSRQYEWLEYDLQSVNRTKTPWVILELHRPLYQSEKLWDNVAVGIGMRYEMEELLYQYQVDLVLSGHYHSYLRTCDGLYESTCGTEGAPTHITVGTAGAQLTHPDPVEPLYPQEWTERFIPRQWGYGRITIYNASTLYFELVAVGAENDTHAGATLDEVWIQRNRSRFF